MLFWKSLENTVADRPDFREWTVKQALRGEIWTRTGAGSFWTKTTGNIGSGREKPLPNFELNKKLWDIFANEHEVKVFFTTRQLNQFNQIFEDWKKFTQS